MTTYTLFGRRMLCLLAALLIMLIAQPAAAQTKRPPLLKGLYVSFVTVQALDIATTRMALSSGVGREANVLVPTNTVGLLALKAVSTTTTLWLAEKLHTKHPRIAIIAIASATALQGAIVAHNYSIIRR